MLFTVYPCFHKLTRLDLDSLIRTATILVGQLVTILKSNLVAFKTLNNRAVPFNEDPV